MPELPEIAAYRRALERRIAGSTLDRIRVRSVALLKTYDPPLETAHGRTVIGVSRIGKRLAIALDEDLHLVLHLMIAGRLHWADEPVRIPPKRGLAAFDFGSGSMLLTEAGTTRRAALHVVRGGEALAALDPGGIEVLDSDLAAFRAALLRGTHTLKRALTDPRAFSGIGGAFADEILHDARLSPLQRTTNLGDDEITRLQRSATSVLRRWIEIRARDAGDRFPERLTAFHPEMAVHGKYGQPCPRCGTKIQRIVYRDRETNYCPECQTEGRILADRALSRLFKDDWAKHLE